MSDDQELEKKEVLDIITKEAKHRPILPFIGAGISISAGFPSIKLLIQYLAKVIFSIDYKILDVSKEETGNYKLYLENKGWPDSGKLNADIWDWLQQKNWADKLSASEAKKLTKLKLNYPPRRRVRKTAKRRHW